MTQADGAHGYADMSEERKVELLACPNTECLTNTTPSCRSTARVVSKGNKHQVWCGACGMRGAQGNSPADAVRLWNLLASRPTNGIDRAIEVVRRLKNEAGAEQARQPTAQAGNTFEPVIATLILVLQELRALSPKPPADRGLVEALEAAAFALEETAHWLKDDVGGYSGTAEGILNDAKRARKALTAHQEKG